MSTLMKDTSFINRPLLAKGKVREIFDLDDSLLMVVTDRVSAFDVVFSELIPDKGVILNSVSEFWFEKLKDIVPNHVITTDPNQYPSDLQKYANQLKGRSMLVKKAKMLPAECIVRGYLEGSALKSYNKDQTVNGIQLPSGLKQGDKLPQVMFTPSTKADEGHDQNISIAEFKDIVGVEIAKKVEEISIQLYTTAEKYAQEKGIIIADTKFEFGIIDGQLTICDELLTPDSSRFWDLREYKPGQSQKSFDKQFLRDWLETLDWNKMPPAPHLPEDIISKTSARYHEAYTLLTGHNLNR